MNKKTATPAVSQISMGETPRAGFVSRLDFVANVDEGEQQQVAGDAQRKHKRDPEGELHGLIPRVPCSATESHAAKKCLSQSSGFGFA
jgi:hypothetical protein